MNSIIEAQQDLSMSVNLVLDQCESSISYYYKAFDNLPGFRPYIPYNGIIDEGWFINQMIQAKRKQYELQKSTPKRLF